MNIDTVDSNVLPIGTSNKYIMKNRRIKFKRFVYGEGYTWNAGGEGKVIAETNTFYKVKTSWFKSEWVYKSESEIITNETDS